MNISSRVALLSVVLLTSSYAFTMDSANDQILKSTEKQQQDQQSKLTDNKNTAEDDQKSMIAKAGGLVAAPFIFVIANANDATGWIADKTINKATSIITATKFLKDTRLNNPDYRKVFGKIVVVSLAGFGLYKLYTMYNDAQDADDEIIFEEEYEDMN